MRSRQPERLDLRIPAAVKDRIRKAASLCGRSMSDLIIEAILDKAETVFQNVERWALDETDSRVIYDLLSQERPRPALAKLLALSEPESEPALAVQKLIRA